jgi:cell division protein FtsQ
MGRRAEAEPLLAGALALAHAWREGARDAAARLSEIHVDPGDGTTLYLGEEGLEVRLGSGDLDAKLSRLERILSTLRAEGKKAEVLHLDDRLHPNRVTVRLAGAGPSPAVKVGAGSREP